MVAPGWSKKQREEDGAAAGSWHRPTTAPGPVPPVPPWKCFSSSSAALGPGALPQRAALWVDEVQNQFPHPHTV